MGLVGSRVCRNVATGVSPTSLTPPRLAFARVPQTCCHPNQRPNPDICPEVGRIPFPLPQAHPAHNLPYTMSRRMQTAALIRFRAPREITSRGPEITTSKKLQKKKHLHAAMLHRFNPEAGPRRPFQAGRLRFPHIARPPTSYGPFCGTTQPRHVCAHQLGEHDMCTHSGCKVIRSVTQAALRAQTDAKQPAHRPRGPRDPG